MIKKIFLSHKEVPVPVPVKTLAEAYSWVQATFVKKNNIITNIVLDGVEVLGELEGGAKFDHELREDSVIEFQLDNPRDLSLQTLEALRDLAFQMDRRLPSLAVKSWQFKDDTHIGEIKEIANDLTLMLDLIEHLNGILQYSHEYLAPVNGLSRLLNRVLGYLLEAAKAADWQRCSTLLLNRLEPLLKDMVAECENLQLNVLSAGIDAFENSLAG